MDDLKAAQELFDIAEDVRIGKIIRAWASTDIKKIVFQMDKTIVRYLKKYGVSRKIHGTGFVIHHFNWSGRKIVKEDISEAQVKKIKRAIRLHGKGEESKLYNDLEQEIKHIVLLPQWFHNYYHANEGNPGWTNLNSREAYYKKMIDCLNTQETYDTVKELQFNPSNIHSAAESIEILALTVHKGNKKYIIDLLERVYKRLKKMIQDYCKKHSF